MEVHDTNDFRLLKWYWSTQSLSSKTNCQSLDADRSLANRRKAKADRSLL